MTPPTTMGGEGTSEGAAIALVHGPLLSYPQALKKYRGDSQSPAFIQCHLGYKVIFWI
jgi:hypothetical protein